MAANNVPSSPDLPRRVIVMYEEPSEDFVEDPLNEEPSEDFDKDFDEDLFVKRIVELKKKSEDADLYLERLAEATQKLLRKRDGSEDPRFRRSVNCALQRYKSTTASIMNDLYTNTRDASKFGEEINALVRLMTDEFSLHQP
jgi:hypothetical protein